ncbi:DUF4756 family protein [Salmonella enterica subsp. enterica serovar Ouagadougou]|uniref:DUF4756 domain-containing protein n=1 Tax=Salmonella enterica subsp. enterica serovar Ouagadougou TaxID=2564899 RepID=A0A5I0D1B3_SALET|nr:DUF4756 domain-containing protein [Salmonella enterica subsp. enterica serovar Ouagadougou]EBR9513506.1 DUF4756 family protein [Salmonella enterica subsp. enterica serovar Ouagadougou]EBV0636880.1 DUF4756 domain-containing protein [Salmonella enterica subsp. enterica serovar Ouagadougou]EBV0755625.1 DUF4756 domain-containing protein [Salmonella enterica subsp. enterica serovar Ouagadougou]EBV0946192.1 DUF4756 domain-containing protein [Salmonella enterica subsp. enterica serovar Ouagadougou]
MRKVKTDNSDLIQYLETIKELKNHISIEEYRNEYRRLRSDDVPLIKAQKFKSAHTELRRLEKKRESLIEYFIDELNPISSSKANTSAKASGNLDLFNERVLYRKAISEKSDDEIFALVIKQRTEAAVEFQRSIEQSLEQLSHISSEFEPSSLKRKKMSL